MNNIVYNDFNKSVAMGLIPDASVVNKFGYNSDVDTGSSETIASFGGTFNIMTTADTLNIVSSSANDAVGNTGCSFILITGIDENNLKQEEYITLTGTTPVTTLNSWLGVNRVVAITTGSNDSNVGNITISDTSATFGTQAYMPINSSVTQQCIYHTQIGYKLLLDGLVIGVLKIAGGGGDPKVTVKGFSYSRVTDTVYEIFRVRIDTTVENHFELKLSQPLILGGREVVYFTAETDKDNTEVAMRFSGVELK